MAQSQILFQEMEDAASHCQFMARCLIPPRGFDANELLYVPLFPFPLEVLDVFSKQLSGHLRICVVWPNFRSKIEAGTSGETLSNSDASKPFKCLCRLP